MATILQRSGGRVRLSGPITCTAGACIRELRVTLNQEGTVAEAQTHGVCEGDGQHWQIEVHASDGGFVAGPADACGLALIQNDAGLVDSHQWCADVALAGETD